LKGGGDLLPAYLQEEVDWRLTIFPSRYNEYDSWCEALDDFMRNSVVGTSPCFRLIFRRARRLPEMLGVDA